MMVNRGFAQKQGVKLDLVQFKSDAAALRALIAGDIDSYDGGFTGTVTAAARGIDIRLLGCDWPGLPQDVFVRPAIATPKDLRGKTVAVSTANSLPDVLAKALLAKYGVPTDSVRFTKLGSDIERYKALVAGTADASVVSSEYAPIAVKDGLRLLVAGRDVLPDYMRVCIFSTGAALGQHPEAAVNFMAAEMQALAYAITHRGETLALTREITGAKPDDPRPAYIYDDAVASHSIDPTLSLPPQKIVWMANELVREGILAQPYDMSHMIDGTVRAKALQLAGM
jgi:NitT/TauT family transport system substrate-binding protein